MSKWISAEERMPTLEDGTVLAVCYCDGWPSPWLLSYDEEDKRWFPRLVGDDSCQHIKLWQEIDLPKVAE